MPNNEGGFMKRKSMRLLALFFALALVATACGDGDTSTESTQAASAETEATDAPTGPYEPASPECVAPSDPGGGWDFTCRTIGQLFEDLGLTSNVVTTNQPGGGGGVAFADIAANRSDNSDLVIAASRRQQSASRRTSTPVCKPATSVGSGPSAPTSALSR